ncbi:MAG: hypothetical protein LUG18_07230 [Candidatus Azobacteroides sp.]|nr:hypothetical protein [Candidatus Azobacteroides sp.]
MKKTNVLKISALFFVSVLLHGCFSARTAIEKSAAKYPIVQNDVYKDVPYDANGAYPNVHFIYTRQREEAMNLPKILNGYNGFILRVWINSPSGTGVQDGELIEIKQTDGEWSGRFYSMKTQFYPTRNWDKVMEYQGYDIRPENLTWNEVMAFLVEEGIFELKSLDQLEAYQQLPAAEKGYPTGSSVISFEVATTKMYRFFHYFALPKFLEIDEVRQVDTIVRFLTREFNVYEVLNGSPQIIIYDLREDNQIQN